MRDKNKFRRGSKLTSDSMRRMERNDMRDYVGGGGVQVSTFGDRIAIGQPPQYPAAPGLQTREFVVKEDKGSYLICHPYVVGHGDFGKAVETEEIKVAKPYVLRKHAPNIGYEIYDPEKEYTKENPPEVILAAIRPTGVRKPEDEEEPFGVNWIDLNISGRGVPGIEIKNVDSLHIGRYSLAWIVDASFEDGRDLIHVKRLTSALSSSMDSPVPSLLITGNKDIAPDKTGYATKGPARVRLGGSTGVIPVPGDLWQRYSEAIYPPTVSINPSNRSITGTYVARIVGGYNANTDDIPNFATVVCELVEIPTYLNGSVSAQVDFPNAGGMLSFNTVFVSGDVSIEDGGIKVFSNGIYRFSFSFEFSTSNPGLMFTTSHSAHWNLHRNDQLTSVSNGGQRISRATWGPWIDTLGNPLIKEVNFGGCLRLDKGDVVKIQFIPGNYSASSITLVLRNASCYVEKLSHERSVGS
jgi:hypothetical protein